MAILLYSSEELSPGFSVIVSNIYLAMFLLIYCTNEEFIKGLGNILK